jgi:hypothetical protein
MSPVLGTGIQKNCRWNKQNLIITGTIGAGTGTGVKKTSRKFCKCLNTGTPMNGRRDKKNFMVAGLNGAGTGTGVKNKSQKFIIDSR